MSTKPTVRVLYVEDDKNIVGVAKKYLEKIPNVEIVLASTIEDARKIMEGANPPKLIVSDLMVPPDQYVEMGGLKVKDAWVRNTSEFINESVAQGIPVAVTSVLASANKGQRIRKELGEMKLWIEAKIHFLETGTIDTEKEAKLLTTPEPRAKKFIDEANRIDARRSDDENWRPPGR